MEKTTIKQENRPDGVTNRTTEVRQALATAMSLFYSWASTASATTIFTMPVQILSMTLLVKGV